MLKQFLQFKLSQKLSPQQIQLMKLIQLPTLAFEQRIKQELEENPALESGKDNMFAGSSFPRCFLLSARDLASLTNTSEREYASPSTLYLKSAKGRRGSLPFVVFVISRR